MVKPHVDAQKIAFYLLILFLPTQLGYHFWPDSAFIMGQRVDYLSPTLYLTDIFVLVLFVLWCAEYIFTKKNLSKLRGNMLIGCSQQKATIAIGLIIAVGVIFAKSPIVGVYGALKLLEMIFVAYYVASVAYAPRVMSVVVLLTSLAMCFESLLAIAQFFNQASLGGIFYLFGERFFGGTTPGIANASIGGQLFLRPYATFPHPNVLAAYLLLSMVFVVNRSRSFVIFPLFIGSIALLLTVSRVAIVLWVLGICYFWYVYGKKKRAYLPVIIGGTITSLYLFAFSPLGQRFFALSMTDEAIVLRLQLAKAALAMMLEHPLFGVGLHNFLVALPAVFGQAGEVLVLQPVHNIFLLVGAELGIVGFFAFCWLFYKTYQCALAKGDRATIFMLLTVLTLGFFDHYFLTLQQGQLLLAFVFGLCFSKVVKPKNEKMVK